MCNNLKKIILDTMTVRKAFQKIFDEMGEMPTHISSDQVLKSYCLTCLMYTLLSNNIIFFQGKEFISQK